VAHDDPQLDGQDPNGRQEGRNVASSSLSDSPSSEDAEKVILAEKDSSAVELRIGGLCVGKLLNKAGLRSITIVRDGCLDR
jgi:hypothetical protein